MCGRCVVDVWYMCGTCVVLHVVLLCWWLYRLTPLIDCMCRWLLWLLACADQLDQLDQRIKRHEPLLFGVLRSHWNTFCYLFCVSIFHCHSRVWCVCWIKKCHSGWNPCTTNKFFIILPRQNSTNWKKTCTPASPTATTPTTTWPWRWKENWTTQWWNWNEPFGNRWTNQFGQWVHAKSLEELEK